MSTPAYEIPGKAITLIPKVSFEEKRYTFVSVDTDGTMKTPAAGEAAVGVVQTPGIIGEPCRVMVTGVSFIALEGVVANGAEVEVGTDGKAKTKATGVAVGVALVGGNAGEIGTILIK